MHSIDQQLRVILPFTSENDCWKLRAWLSSFNFRPLKNFAHQRMEDDFTHLYILKESKYVN
jgi:hypothetical protein